MFTPHKPGPSDPDCEFCLEFQSLPGHAIWEFREELSIIPEGNNLNRVFSRINDVVIFPSLGQITHGHALITPFHHFTNVISLPSDLFRDVVSMVERVVHCYSIIFGASPMLFEHGEPKGSRHDSAKCIDHAHIHVIPEPIDLIGIVAEEYNCVASIPFTEAREILDHSYSMIIDADGIAHFFDTIGAPRQYLRRKYAGAIGRPEIGSWTSNINLNNTFQDAEFLRMRFEEILSLLDR